MESNRYSNEIEKSPDLFLLVFLSNNIHKVDYSDKLDKYYLLLSPSYGFALTNSVVDLLNILINFPKQFRRSFEELSRICFERST